MHNNWIACIVVLLSILPTFTCFCHKDGENNCLCIKDQNLVIQRVMSVADSASIPCPGLELSKENVSIILHKETELHSTHFQATQVTNTSRKKQRFSVHVENDTAKYVIDRPQVNDTGLYKCTVSYRHAHKTTWIFLLVKEPCITDESLSWVLPAAGCGLLALYNLIVTIISCFFAWKLGHQDTYENDYINTRPGELSRNK
ncbi:uncharacterized protein LOC128524547 [Clarias gariepinus]|uniref:uncharacterized protein LOC128524547 n=1 Tax=Clarias gariepinus TaxID=13013 RepID=UPI00234C8207|nr:uncharacterized protein LOC128524547 [Clarias gariepinus]